MNSPRFRLAWVAFALLACTTPAFAQVVLIDHGTRAAGLWCFPLPTDTLSYVYVPAAARLATDEAGHPQFSFVRYVVNERRDSSTSSTITDARGGGILTFLVMIDTDPRLAAEAQSSLRKTLKNDSIRVRGPVIFQDGRYTLVSSVLQPGGVARPAVLATGRAPVLEGNRLALSFDLDAEHATLLMQSFSMATPDVSLMFDMTVAGLTDAYDAELTVDWSEVKKNKSFSTGGTIYYVSADIDLALDELRRENAIKLKSSGTSTQMEALLTTVYNRLLELMFKPVVPEHAPASKQNDMMGAMSAMFSGKGAASSRKTMGFGAQIAYQQREMRTEGTSVMHFDHRATVERHALIAFNIGDLFTRHGSDPHYFRAVNLGDAMFQQREVQVAVDAALVPEFDRYVNSVTVTLRKDHANGQQTLREIVLNRANATVSPGERKLIYGWDGDDDRLAWLDYDFRARWSFKGGGVFETPWTRMNSPMIDLFAPYERRSVQMVGDPAALKARGVRAVVLQIEYPFFGEQRRPQLVARPEDSFEDKRVEITLPLGQPDYEYTLTWQLAGNQHLTAHRRDASGLVFVDELP